MRRLLSFVKLYFSSLYKGSSVSDSSYHSYSRSMLLLLCYWKDSDILEWKYACNTLLNVCYAMQERHQFDYRLKNDNVQTESLVNHDVVDLERTMWQTKMQSLEQLKNQEIDKLQTEINWLQHRLAEKLQQTRRQNDIIDELKRDLVESIQQAKISEGRCLCYEHKIKNLEEQLEHVLRQ